MNENDKHRRSRRRGGHSSSRGAPSADKSQGKTQGAKPDISARVEAEQRSSRGRGEGRDRSENRQKGTERVPSIADRGFDRSGDLTRKKAFLGDRPRWAPPRQAPVALPKLLCPRCGKPIEDISAAVNDRESGEPWHFDCVLSRISDAENLREGEKVIYIGGGRFGVVLFDDPQDLKKFKIIKVVQWEEKEKRAPWRREITEQFSTT